MFPSSKASHEMTSVSNKAAADHSRINCQSTLKAEEIVDGVCVYTLSLC